jgi:hypothetical protein
MVTYPYPEDAILVNSIKASTLVSVLEGMEVSTTTFTSALGGATSTVIPLSGPGPVIQNGILGSVPLSPVRSKALSWKNH